MQSFPHMITHKHETTKPSPHSTTKKRLCAERHPLQYRSHNTRTKCDRPAATNVPHRKRFYVGVLDEEGDSLITGQK